MKSLEESRAVIDAVDREIVRLFEERMNASRDVARYKIGHGLPVLDAAREDMVIASRMSMLKDGYWAQSVRELYTCIMALSRAEQERMLQQTGEEKA